MITTVTLNPCIDRTIEIEKFLYGGTNKVLSTRNDISGKGINVNIVLQHLGVKNKAIGFNYIEDGLKLKGFLEKLGSSYNLVDVEGQLRINVKIFDSESSIMSEFNDRGYPVKKESVEEFINILKETLKETSILVVGGSVPPGVEGIIYRKIIEEANKMSVKTVLDASGELLREGIKARPYLIKPNESELEKTYGEKINSSEDVIRISRKIIDEGIKYVCVSRGSKGAILVSKDEVYIANPIKIDVKGVQGAGDSMVAGFCYAIENNLGTQEILRYGVACATGSLIYSGTQLTKKEDMEKFLSLVEIRRE